MWFANFDNENDKKLAKKIILNIRYFNVAQFAERIMQLQLPVLRFLSDTDRSFEQVLLVVPNDLADSADRHAYDVVKKWKLKNEQVVKVDDLRGKATRDSVIVFFNDTHGTGNQFARELLSRLGGLEVAAIFVLAVTVSEKAIRRFATIPSVRLVPREASVNAADVFTAAEFQRIRELGMKVYPTHPVGYGDAALLTAYYFQCPNNSLPLIWADGANNAVDGKAFPWSPLFPYQPKARQRPVSRNVPAPVKGDPVFLSMSCKWEWTQEEIDQLEQHVVDWNLTSPQFYERAGRWLANFTREEKELAYRVFLSTQYLNLEKTRTGIRKLRQSVLTDIQNAGGDTSDILLVTTGDDKVSAYHYVYEFMRSWQLTVDQVCGIKRLTPDKVIDKTLVFFYHTRASADYFVENCAADLRDLSPRSVFVAAYAMTPRARTEFQDAFDDRVKYAYLEHASRTAAELLPGPLITQLDALGKELKCGTEHCGAGDELLIAYYFQCPQISSPLLWSERNRACGGRPWVPLFRHIDLPR